MIIDKPENLNGQELREQLRAANVMISDDVDAIEVIENKLILKIDDKNISKAENVVKQHDGKIVPSPLTINQKLENAGLNLNDLKDALGL